MADIICENLKPGDENSVDENLKPGERIDDLQREGYRIIQDSEKFCFGMDAVLLSAFAVIPKGAKVLDMGTGTGVIPILMEARNPDASYVGLEIQPEVADMARRSVRLNGLDSKIAIKEGDIKEASVIFGGASFDIVTTNPPYMNESHGLKNPSDTKAIARHEVLCNLEDVVREAAKCLKSGGKFFMVHRPHRLVEIFETMRKYGLEPKRIRMVHPKAGDEAKMVLIEGARSGGAWLKVEKPLVIYDDNGEYNKEIFEIYNGDK